MLDCVYSIFSFSLQFWQKLIIIPFDKLEPPYKMDVLTFVDNQRANSRPSLHGTSGKPHHFSRLVHPVVRCVFVGLNHSTLSGLCIGGQERQASTICAVSW
jgi:hypothetical protein